MNLYLRLLRILTVQRLRRRVSLWDTVETAFRVWPTDLDVLGHMTNSRYLALMDLARTDHMLRSGFWAQAREHGWYAVVAGQTITYRRSLQPWQSFRISTRILGADGRWVYLEQTFLDARGPAAQAVVRARFLRREGGSVEVDELMEVAGEPGRDLTVEDWIVRWSADTAMSGGRGAAKD
ncbi:thioesterase family protein [Brachybacterium sp. AOP25-B2-12]|uniref:thioesterase family protein n=1 Tax=Brachybacterium sp. AOP25-B2-12 TaxID=3457710 RepID=UPI004033A7FC